MVAVSFGVSYISTVLDDAVRNLTRIGIPVIVAAGGNNTVVPGEDACFFSPAREGTVNCIFN